MSNLIKYPFVNLEGKDAVIINSNEEDDFKPLLKELQEEKEHEDEEEAGDEEADFSPGLNVINYDKILEEEKEKCRKEAEHILEEARTEAAHIRDTAKQEVDQRKEEAYQDGYSEGFIKGEEEAKVQYQRLESELHERKEKQEKEYTKVLEEIEPRYVNVLISLIQKITGVLMEDRQDLILYLIKNSIENLDKSEHYVIRISSEDSFLVDSNKKELKEVIGDNASLELMEEKDLKQGDCIIETDNQMVDCGLKTQLVNLTETLKMMR